jgi:type IV pilus assembly protein PilC
MNKYKFKAVRPSGEKYEGEKEAESKFEIFEQIRKEGATPVHVEEIVAKKSKSIQLPGFLNRVKMTDKIQFAKNLGVMIEAGLPMTRALAVIERQTKGEAFKKVLVDLSAGISKGDTLSSAMEKHPRVFTKLFLSMVKAGEESGSLTSSLKAVGEQLEKAYLLTKKIRGAMIYPVIILCIMVAIAFLMLIFVVPTLSSVFLELDVELPLMTRMLIGVSDFLKNNIFLTLGFLVVLIVGFVYAKRTAYVKKKIDFAVLKLPIVSGIAKEINSARTARTLSSLLRAGVDILAAIKISGDVVQNVYYKEVLKKAEAMVESGKPISGVFIAEEKLYPAFVGEMTSIGEETGKLAEMCENVAIYYENEVDQKTKDLSTVIEPFLMVFIGIAVGFFAVSMLSPIYSLVDAI